MENRQKAVVSLIRTLFLKRFESSAKAFEFSCGALLIKLLAWTTKHSRTVAAVHRLDRWKRQHEELIQYVAEGHRELMGDIGEGEAEEDIIDADMLEGIEELSPAEYKVDEILDETYLDLEQILEFIRELKRFKPAGDDKLKALVKLLRQDKDLVGQKVLIFSEFMATTRYLKKQLEEAGFTDVDEVDSASGRDRSEIICIFRPIWPRIPG